MRFVGVKEDDSSSEPLAQPAANLAEIAVAIRGADVLGVPRFDVFVDDGVKDCGWSILPCNWLQIMENSVDPVHTEWLHGALYEFRHEAEKKKVAISRHHAKIAFDEFPYGIIKRRVVEGGSDEDDDWKHGHPALFPNYLRQGGGSNKGRSSGGGAGGSGPVRRAIPFFAGF